MSAHVLVVEDEAMVRRLVSKLLKKDGYTVTQASNGAEALEIFDLDEAAKNAAFVGEEPLLAYPFTAKVCEPKVKLVEETKGTKLNVVLFINKLLISVILLVSQLFMTPYVAITRGLSINQLATAVLNSALFENVGIYKYIYIFIYIYIFYSIYI